MEIQAILLSRLPYLKVFFLKEMGVAMMLTFPINQLASVQDSHLYMERWTHISPLSVAFSFTSAVNAEPQARQCTGALWNLTSF